MAIRSAALGRLAIAATTLLPLPRSSPPTTTTVPPAERVLCFPSVMALPFTPSDSVRFSPDRRGWQGRGAAPCPAVGASLARAGLLPLHVKGNLAGPPIMWPVVNRYRSAQRKEKPSSSSREETQKRGENPQEFRGRKTSLGQAKFRAT